MALFEFTLDANDKTYKCERFVSGQGMIQQTVKVLGIGSQNDPATYSDKSDQRYAMQLNARLIAHQIVKGAAGS